MEHAFQDKTVLVTGAASGIGLVTARRFAKAGAIVAIVDISENTEVVAASIPNALAHRLDITDPVAVRAVVAELESQGGVDILINNAMICTDVGFLDLTPEEMQRDIAVGLLGPMYLSQAIIPGMQSRGGGVILNISSVNGLAYFGNEPYSAAKAGLMNLTAAIANQFGADGIRCVAVAPGTIATEYWRHRLAHDPDVLDKAARWYPLGRVGTPDDVVEALLFLASEHAAWITGTTLTVDGGLLTGNREMVRSIQAAAAEQ